MKKSSIISMETIAYYSGFNGLEIKYIEYDIDDYLYCVSGACSPVSKQKPHKLKIYYNERGAFIQLYGYKIPLDECMRV